MGTARHRLPAQSSAPSKKLLDEMLAECLQSSGELIELPVKVPDSLELLRLTVELEPGGVRAVWTLYAGEGESSRSLWKYAIRDTDMIAEVLSLSMSAKTLAEPAQLPPAAEPTAKVTSGQQDSVPTGELVSSTAALHEPYSQTDMPNILLGHILVDSGLIPEPVLDAALSLQEMVRQNSLSAAEATDALRKVYSRGADLQEVISEIKRKRGGELSPNAVDLLRQAGFINEQDIAKAKHVVELLRKAGFDSPKANDNAQTLLDLLRLSGLIRDEDIRQAATSASNRPTDICKALLSADKVELLSFEVAARFVKHVRLGTFKQEQAVIALHYSQRCRTGFEETVHSLGWQVPLEN